jgi:Superfamily II DNA/RNA helicases, SNF2 family
MGKTIMLSALIQANPGSDLEEPAEDFMASTKNHQLKLNNAFRAVPHRKSRPSKVPAATLIVAPTSLLSQWSEEIQRSSKPGTTKVLVWHGQNRLDLEAAIEDDDEDDKSIKVIVTSYGVLSSEHAKSEKSNGAKSPVFESELDFPDDLADKTDTTKSIGSVSFLTRLILVNLGLVRLPKRYMLFGRGDDGR